MINDDVREMSAVRRIDPDRKAGSIGTLKEPRIRQQIEKICPGTAKVGGRRVERRGRDPLGARLPEGRAQYMYALEPGIAGAGLAGKFDFSRVSKFEGQQ